ncbi:MAG: DUF975 family protein [Planctomycetota bacterium]|nr:DUF975 family protein [Planctomycetota bacterium]
MSIEFRCTQCSKLLRTGDDTAGKAAKCPACQTIVTVPDASQATPQQPASQPQSPTPPQPESPFGGSQTQAAGSPFDSSYTGQGYGAAAPQPDSGNPYQAPADYATPSGYGAVAAGEIRPSEIDFGEAFSRTWAAFTDQLGMCILVAFLCGLMGMVAGYVAQFAGMAAAMASGDEVVGVVVQITLRIPAQLFSIWIGIGQAIFFLKVARGQEAPIGDIFAGGPYFLRVLGASILLGLAAFAAVVLCCAPGGVIALIGMGTGADELLAVGGVVAVIGGLVGFAIYAIVMLIFFQFYYLIVDRNMGIMDAFRTSRQVMSGNKATVFGLFLVTGILGMLFVICTCFIGMLAYIPYMGILTAIVYLLATGQPTMSDYREMQYQQQPGQ